MKKNVIFFVLILTLGTGVFAQTSKSALGGGLEWNMSSRRNFAGALAFSFDYNIHRYLAVGMGLYASHNFNNAGVIEPAALFRVYITPETYSGIFFQADVGAFFLLEEDETYPYFLGGFRTGYSFRLKERFYAEPYIRAGYPFAFGVGVLAGFSFYQK